MVRTVTFCILALLGFAANSLLTRLALRPHLIDAATFVAIRLAAGVVSLTVLGRLRRPAADPREGSWLSALLLFAYAAPFSFAYLRMSAGVGALVAFGSVQVTMIGWGLFRGDRPSWREWAGLALAFAGLGALSLPGTTRPDMFSFFLMVVAGMAWGAYSLRGRSTRDPLAATSGNFLRTLPLAAALLVGVRLIPGLGPLHADGKGIALSVLSGALSSGVAYTFWYAALPRLRALHAALVQLTVPVIAALAAVVLLDERPTLRLLGAGSAVLGGVSLALLGKARAKSPTT